MDTLASCTRSSQKSKSCNPCKSNTNSIVNSCCRSKLFVIFLALNKRKVLQMASDTQKKTPMAAMLPPTPFGFNCCVMVWGKWKSQSGRLWRQKSNPWTSSGSIEKGLKVFIYRNSKRDNIIFDSSFQACEQAIIVCSHNTWELGQLPTGNTCLSDASC